MSTEDDPQSSVSFRGSHQPASRLFVSGHSHRQLFTYLPSLPCTSSRPYISLLATQTARPHREKHQRIRASSRHKLFRRHAPAPSVVCSWSRLSVSLEFAKVSPCLFGPQIRVLFSGLGPKAWPKRTSFQFSRPADYNHPAPDRYVGTYR